MAMTPSREDKAVALKVVPKGDAPTNIAIEAHHHASGEAVRNEGSAKEHPGDALDALDDRGDAIEDPKNASSGAADPSTVSADSLPVVTRDGAAYAAKRKTARASEMREESQADADAIDLSSPEFYLNRELTWLEYTRRVLHEAEDERNPLLERLKFMAIVSSNLDEFFMKRIGGLKRQVGAGVRELTVDGRTPQQQIDECCATVRDIETQKEELFIELLEQLDEQGIIILAHAELDDDKKHALRDYYVQNIFPLITPQALDPAHPFPFISNLSLNLFVTLRYEDSDELLRARVKVPVGAGIPRFLRIGDSNRFVPLEQVIASNLDLLFPKLIVEACDLFHVTRNANTERDEDEADDLLSLIESELRDRRFASIVRIVVQRSMDDYLRGMLAAVLGLDERTDVFETDGMLAMGDLLEFAALEIPELHDPPHHPSDHGKLEYVPKIFYAIRDSRSILLQHPYEAFSSSVERFVKEASQDPKVRAIKMTLYRTSQDTKIIDYLIDAARNGKQVAVVVELKARFDEAANIRWAGRMEQAGIHVTYGVVGLKTHCKVILVVRQDYSGLRRYVHIGTGNYHAGTARLYDDLGILTCDEAIGRDVTELFNYLTTGYTPKRDYTKILPGPKLLKRSLLAKIQREIETHSKEQPGLIQFKLNALEDADITRALYDASRVGVRVDLIVRDTCRLRPGVPDLSENIRVISIVGRFLEHSRVYYFRNGGEEEYYIGSADAMKRNLEHRVEVLVPVEDSFLCEELRRILDLHLSDHRNAWDMRPDGRYIQRQPANAEAQGQAADAEAKEEPLDVDTLGCQEQLVKLAAQRLKAAKRLRRRKAESIGRRNIGQSP